jgi:hypothetical protein
MARKRLLPTKLYLHFFPRQVDERGTEEKLGITVMRLLSRTKEFTVVLVTLGKSLNLLFSVLNYCLGPTPSLPG